MIFASRNYPFGGRVTTIHTPGFNCIVSTAKDGLFKKNSTAITEIRGADKFSDKWPVAKATYPLHLDNSVRLQTHDHIADALNSQGEQGISLRVAMAAVIPDLIGQGIIQDLAVFEV